MRPIPTRDDEDSGPVERGRGTVTDGRPAESAEREADEAWIEAQEF